MPFSEGDVVLVDYSMFIKETGELVTTTSESIAKLYKKFKEDEVYEPEVVIIGEGRLVTGFEEALRNAEVGKEYEIEVPPSKAFGERDASKVRTYSRRLFIRNRIIPEVGKEVTINNMTGRIIAVNGGRVVVDFNHPLAGKTLRIKFKVIKKLEDPIEKIKYLIKRRLKGIKLENIKVEIREGVVSVELPKSYRLANGVQLIKYLSSRDIIRWVKDVKEVVFVDRFVRDEFRGGHVEPTGQETTRS